MPIFKKEVALDMDKLSHFKEQSILSTLKLPFRLASDCFKLIMEKRKKQQVYILTNQKSVKDKKFYNLYVEHEKLNLVEIQDTKKRLFTFSFSDQVLTLNGKIQNASFVEQFNQKLDNIMDDLRKGKARLWESHRDQ